ncbi:MAG TPA: hypothetical protein VF286_13985 [Acidiphilium sp.]
MPTVNSPPSFHRPVSQICTQAQFDAPAYHFWCRKIRETPRVHRKQWEFCYILQALASTGALAPSSRGVGYGVGQEPLPAVFAACGCEVLATDLDFTAADASGWIATNQHAQGKDALNLRGICDPQDFERLVSFRSVDMNEIPDDIAGFDFTWSACALEHLGSLRHGFDFIEATLATLIPGGVAVHTTELNCSSNEETVETGGTVLYRKRDIMEFCHRMENQGHEITLNLNHGNLPLDYYIDAPPYTSDKHIRLQLGRFVTTSIGLIVRKAWK